MITYESFKKKLLKDPDVLKAYEEHKAEFDIARALIEARSKAHMTQADVAQKMQTSQAQIARMESGSHWPSLQSIHKYAQAVNQIIHFDITP